ncbi:MAG: nucleotidyltransferase domain-containing protein [archaeon]
MQKWIEDFRRKVIKKYSPTKIILFGSRARHDNFIESDIDIVIISDKFSNIKWPNRLALVSDLWKGLITIEPLCYTNEEFNKKKEEIGIVAAAVKEGVELAVS